MYTVIGFKILSLFSAASIYIQYPEVRFLESQGHQKSVLSVKTGARIKLRNWLPADTRPVCHYTAQRCVAYWNLKVASRIWIEDYTGLG